MSELTVRLGEVLQRSNQAVELQPNKEYREITVKLWGKGVVSRGIVKGAEVAARRRQIAHTGQFILSRIDARNGAFGIVPGVLDEAIVSNDFPVFNLNRDRLLPQYLGWLSRTAPFVEQCQRASEGTTNRVRISEDRFLSIEIVLPGLSEQQRIVARIEDLVGKINEACALRLSAENDLAKMLLGAFNRVADSAPRLRMNDIAPIVRRPVDIDPLASYPELGIRSFGKGTFHKPALSGIEVGSKRLYRIELNDLLFSNVFAWEGAIAVVRQEDSGRYGSHRFIACVPKAGLATSEFLCFYFLIAEGLGKIGRASPGGAGRNRTLGLDALSRIEVPVPSFDKQKWFTSVLHDADKLRCTQTATTVEMEAILPSILDRAFKGEL
jgi:type I restriction enzyme, S subunit